eukprot:TRINITY_DN12060_c0_g1_i1.p1 TRINITY_DN12060_c0_g1~~TRINITY_DN12060_c0_g1_i1.p1  ORF type:complete len:332 (-),score=79.90 TRINITY_DN12060_c0_g1_i1:28-897(-)
MYGISTHKISKLFSSEDCLAMAQEMFNAGIFDAAQSWVEIAEEKYLQSSTNDITEEAIHDLKTEICDAKIDEEGNQMFENLCKRLETAGHDETFKNSSTSCRYAQEGDNPLFIKKLEELSKEPIVSVIHDFLTAEEVNDILNKSAKYKFDPAPTVGENDDSKYDDARVAISYYIDEEEDDLGDVMNKIKKRMSRLSNINMDHSETLEIVRYRPGGHHTPHVDYYKDEEEILEETDGIYGNRFAQGFLLLSSTKIGGNFVMPWLGISVVPHPGSLVIWHNTNMYGNMDNR